MKKESSFQIAKVQAQSVASLLLNFCQFQPSVTCKSVAYKKACIYFSSDSNLSYSTMFGKYIAIFSTGRFFMQVLWETGVCSDVSDMEWDRDNEFDL